MGVRTFSSFGNAWTCACGHVVEDDYIEHALGCNLLSGLVQSPQDDTADVLRGFISRLVFSSSYEGRYSLLEYSIVPCDSSNCHAHIVHGIRSLSKVLDAMPTLPKQACRAVESM
jgi:hypothetical protein